MYGSSDCFAFMYAVDLHTLDLVIREACRILAERERSVGIEAQTAIGLQSHPARSH
jgi:hypothetical protein